MSLHRALAALTATLCAAPLAPSHGPRMARSPSPPTPIVAVPQRPSPAIRLALAKLPIRPPARRSPLTPVDRETVAACLVLEAASQGRFGMHGVMAVIRNRSHANPACFAKTVLRSHQFSSLNRVTSNKESLWRAIRRAKRDRMWPAALKLVDQATVGPWHDPTGGATHYTRLGEHAAWTYALARTTVIGAHAFYR